MFAITACTALGHSGYADVLHIDGGPFLVADADGTQRFLVGRLERHGSLSFQIRCMNAGMTVSCWRLSESGPCAMLVGGSGWVAAVTTWDGDYLELRPEGTEFLGLLEGCASFVPQMGG